MAISMLIVLLCSVIHAEAGKSSLIVEFSGALQRIQALLKHNRNQDIASDPVIAEDGQLHLLLTGLQSLELLGANKE